VIFRILHLLYMPDTMVNVIIEIFIKESIRWSSFVRKDVALSYYHVAFATCFYCR
jgi:hypothetical protein